MSPEAFRIFSMWPARQETAAQIAARYRAFLALSVSPPGRHWFACEKPDTHRNIEVFPDRIEGFVADGGARNENGSERPDAGYFQLFSAMCADLEPRIDDPYIHARTGSGWQNDMQIFSDNGGVTDPRYIAYPSMRTNVLAVARAFQPDWCQAGPITLGRFRNVELYNRPAMSPAWMIWLCPAYAVHVEQMPVDVVVEPQADGSLFMAATPDTFVTENPVHLAAARRIHAVVDPLNYTIPFNGNCGPNPWHRRA